MMNNEKWADALNEISDKHLQEAIQSKKKSRRVWWLGAIAAALAVVIFLNSGGGPVLVQAAEPLAAPEYPEMVPYPNSSINSNNEPGAYDSWVNSQKAFYDQPSGYADSLTPFFQEVIPAVLAETNENAVCSPLNIYMALAMLAETAEGDSRQQVLALLGAGSLEDSRTQAGHVWKAHYRADGSAASLLANSLWMNDGYYYNRSTVNTLADSYYASVYQGDLGSEEMNGALRAWLSEQTQGLLDKFIQNVSMDSQTLLTLASTVYYRVRWSEGNKFNSKNNTEGIFHTPSWNVSCTFMNQTMIHGPYYYGEDYGAVYLDLDFSGGMWLILPDEGYEVWDILDSGHAMDMILTGKNKNRTAIKVHLSVPKFDISAETDLRQSLTVLGLGDLFDPEEADFSAILPGSEGVYLGKTSHAARVAIDEEGITAAAYTMMQYYGAPMPTEEEVYFTLDRPFLFVITSEDGLPLFTGVVNQP